MRRTWIMALLTLLGLGLGVGLGLAVGWLWWPVEYYDTEFTDLEQSYLTDYVLMVSDTYALTGDLKLAQERLRYLDAPDMAALVLSHVETARAAGAHEVEIGRLVRLAAALGTSSPTPAPSSP